MPLEPIIARGGLREAFLSSQPLPHPQPKLQEWISPTITMIDTTGETWTRAGTRTTGEETTGTFGSCRPCRLLRRAIFSGRTNQAGYCSSAGASLRSPPPPEINSNVADPHMPWVWAAPRVTLVYLTDLAARNPRPAILGPVQVRRTNR